MVTTYPINPQDTARTIPSAGTTVQRDNDAALARYLYTGEGSERINWNLLGEKTAQAFGALRSAEGAVSQEQASDRTSQSEQIGLRENENAKSTDQSTAPESMTKGQSTN